MRVAIKRSGAAAERTPRIRRTIRDCFPPDIIVRPPVDRLVTNSDDSAANGSELRG